jgi:hypothetical protein
MGFVLEKFSHVFTEKESVTRGDNIYIVQAPQYIPLETLPTAVMRVAKENARNVLRYTLYPTHSHRLREVPNLNDIMIEMSSSRKVNFITCAGPLPQLDENHEE